MYTTITLKDFAALTNRKDLKVLYGKLTEIEKQAFKRLRISRNEETGTYGFRFARAFFTRNHRPCGRIVDEMVELLEANGFRVQARMGLEDGKNTKYFVFAK